MLDTNSDLTKKYTVKLLHQTNMYDVMGYMHNTQTPNTYIRGSMSIDFIFATASLLSTIKQASMIWFKDGIQNNHRGLCLDLNYKDVPQNIVTTSDTQFGKYTPLTKHVVHCTHLKKRYTELYQSSQIADKIATLKKNLPSQSRQQSITDLNYIDTLVDKAMLQPLKTISPPTSASWSPALQDGKILSITILEALWDQTGFGPRLYESKAIHLQ